MSLHPNYRLFGRSIFSLLFLLSFNAGIVQAQITPDGTLPTSVQESENMRKITGGEQVGNNLYHSFEKFSIPEGIEAIFENAPDIQNIFTRVTGGEASFVNGLLQTAGGANFFLINPNGIVFGENARLDVGGSFIATTANEIEFADGKTFNVRDEKPLLTWNAPIGLGLDGNNGSITVNGSGSQVIDGSTVGQFSPFIRDNSSNGLRVKPKNTLALVGGEINIQGGILVAEGGRIELGSVNSGNPKIELKESEFRINYEEVSDFKDTILSEKALADVSGVGGGFINIRGSNIQFSGKSLALIQNDSQAASGSISIHADKSLIFNQSDVVTENLDSGDSAAIEFKAKDLSIQDGASISTIAYGAGKSGSVNIEVIDSIQLLRTRDGLIEGDNSSISTLTVSEGDAGKISVSASKFKATNGSPLTSQTLGTGNAGNIDVNINFIELNGLTEKDGLFTFISSGTLNTGNAGNVDIATDSLRLSNGATISSDSIANGNAGNVTITASSLIEVIGTDPNTKNSSALTSSVTIERNEAFRSALGLPLNPEGNAGNIVLNSPTLNISRGGAISVRNEGIGSAGTLSINADNLSLDESGSITAAAESGLGGNIFLNTKNLNITNDSRITAAAAGNEDGGNITINTTNLTAKKNNQITASAADGEGGNININASDSLFLRDRDSISATSESGLGGNITLATDQLQLLNNSNISTNVQGLGDGGNIDIDAGNVLAVNDSDVTATAIRGNGGNITITAEGILGIEERKATPGNGTSDIDASSEFGEDGTVKISDPQVLIQDPIIAIREIDISEPDEKIKSKCGNEDRSYPKLVYTGRSGFSAEPDEYNDGEQYFPAPDYVTSPEEETEDWDFPIWKEGDPLIEANAIRVDSNGETYFVAELSPQSAESLLCTAREEERNQK